MQKCRVENAFLIAATGEFITGMLGNSFIVLVNCIDWVKSQKLSSADCILTSLALSRIVLLCTVLFDSYFTVFWAHLYATDKLAKFINIFWTLSNHLATWFATCLNVFYFFKIANFSHPCFTWLRWRLSRVLLVLPLGSLFLLFCNFELSDIFTNFWVNVYRGYKRNSTWSLDVSKTLYFNSLIVFSFIYLIPFLLSLASLLLLFLSLMRHTRNMQLNSGSRDFSTEAHKRAMKMVMSFLLLSTVHFSFLLITGWTFLLLHNSQVSFVVILLSTLFPSGHSFILILGNSKLRKTALGLLWHLNRHLKMVKPLASQTFPEFSISQEN
ncbi:LOW QUALITY PROTEIN: taste receptor type 2 member 42-like [Ailuropoda melanoleuca]|uniref:LOW QUALITY PROTEIN: taste receptor type 2 member 42-like n=1 Tax=Ailuropoda melanoleuca TaxID=9646 RepID=UPI001493FA97|nr:LOW QUALITY PROTEIN: taste receptor type 2 member 42-like [Ailuropoda melanoleuca]